MITIEEKVINILVEGGRGPAGAKGEDGTTPDIPLIPLIYKILLNQTGINNPDNLVLANTINTGCNWQRIGVGKYKGTFTNPISGTFCYRKRESYLAFDDGEHIHIDINVTSNYILIDQFVNQYTPLDGLNFYFENFPFLLEVYPINP